MSKLFLLGGKLGGTLWVTVGEAFGRTSSMGCNKNVLILSKIFS